MTGPDQAGAHMFVRYAYPPNSLGYCGPDSFREYAVAGVADQGLVQLARAFSGAWPYLELISAGCGIPDPLDHRVVEAYWVDNELLDRVPVGKIGDSMAERFRQRVGNKFQFLAEGDQHRRGLALGGVTIDVVHRVSKEPAGAAGGIIEGAD